MRPSVLRKFSAALSHNSASKRFRLNRPILAAIFFSVALVPLFYKPDLFPFGGDQVSLLEIAREAKQSHSIPQRRILSSLRIAQPPFIVYWLMATTSVAKSLFFQNLSVVLLCASALALLYFLLSKSCGQWVAVLLAAMAATNPGLVYYSRIITHVPFLFVGSVWFLRSAVGFYFEKRPRFLLLLWVSAVVAFLAHYGALALRFLAGGLTILIRMRSLASPYFGCTTGTPKAIHSRQPGYVRAVLGARNRPILSTSDPGIDGC